MLQLRFINHIHAIGAASDEFWSEFLDAGAKKNGREFDRELVSEFASLAEEFERYVVEHALALFGYNPDPSVVAWRDRLLLLLSEDDRIKLARFHACATERAVILDDRDAVAHLDGVVETGPYAKLTAYASFLDYLDAAHAALS
jgi:hypothetical protein